jgi:hypothetical protein
MTMRTVGIWLTIATSSACITQRSLSVGQTAAAVGRGGADLNVMTGVMYQSQTAPPTSSTDVGGATLTNQSTSRGFSLPWFEANANFGMNERLGLNVHMSPAGIQPGLKITLNRSPIASVALLPELGLGYASVGNVTNVSGADGRQMEVSPTSNTRFLFTGGMKVLLSHRSGFYAGVGYDLYFTRSVTNGTIGSGGTVQLTQSVNTSVQHQISGSLGFSIAMGMISIRPEVAFAVIPAISESLTSGSGNMSVEYSGGYGWAILPGFGFALTTPPDRRDKGGEEDDRNVGTEGDDRTDEEVPPPRKERDREDEN